MILISPFQILLANAAENSIQARVQIEGSGLHISSRSKEIDFGTITIDGSNVVKKATLDPVVIEDFTGSANGWNVNVRATPFQKGDQEFPENSLILHAGIALQTMNSSDTLPHVLVSGRYPIDNNAGIKLIAAEKEEGMGEFFISFPKEALQLSIKTNELQTSPETYTSTITWSIVTGP